jgi:hypothetical protein
MKDIVSEKIRDVVKQVVDADMFLMLLLKSQARLLKAILAQESKVVDPSRSLLETIEVAK